MAVGYFNFLSLGVRIQPVLCEKSVLLLILGIDKGIPERFSFLAAWETLSHIWGSVVQRKDASQASGTWLGNHGPSEWLGDEQEGRDARYPPDTMTAARVRVSSGERRPGPSASLRKRLSSLIYLARAHTSN